MSQTSTNIVLPHPIVILKESTNISLDKWTLVDVYHMASRA